ncbi:hypothetical protein GCM10023168_22240 [Fodinibacter luteus]|uniref:Uncharacterized protein n=1 Tax=Fodinibacter luteus TaxID=552064 RepID=A0ABP8KIK2_9MICO
MAASLLMVGVAAVSPAAADPPDITRYPDAGITWMFPDPVNGYANRCEFPVMYQDEGKLVDIQFSDGRYLGTAPGLRATVTNLDTGESIDLMVNGSVKIAPPTPVGTQGHYVEVLRFTGPLIDLAPGHIIWSTGQTVTTVEYDQSGNVTSTTSYTAPPLDVCAALAP